MAADSSPPSEGPQEPSEMVALWLVLVEQAADLPFRCGDYDMLEFDLPQIHEMFVHPTSPRLMAIAFHGWWA
jgi:hypothetical protein